MAEEKIDIPTDPLTSGELIKLERKKELTERIMADNKRQMDESTTKQKELRTLREDLADLIDKKKMNKMEIDYKIEIAELKIKNFILENPAYNDQPKKKRTLNFI